MAWTKQDVDDHIKGLDDRAKTVWVRVANEALQSCEEKGEKDCEQTAIKQASGVAGRVGEAMRVTETYLLDAFVARSLAPVATLDEAGRKLSGKNEGRVRAAMDQLAQMLAELERAYADEEKSEDDEEKGEGEQESLADIAALRAAFQVLSEVSMSHDERRMALHRALNAAAVSEAVRDEDAPYRTPVALYDGRVVFHEDGPHGGRLMECFYSVGANGGIKLGEASEAEAEGCADCAAGCPCAGKAEAKGKTTQASESGASDCTCDDEDCECVDDCTDCTPEECDSCTDDCQCAESANESGVTVLWPDGRNGSALVIREAEAPHGTFEGQHSHGHSHGGDMHTHMHAHDGDAGHSDHEHNDGERASLGESARPMAWLWGHGRDNGRFGWYEVTERDMDPKVGGGVDRDKLKASDFAWPDTKSYPIVTKGDVSDAVSSVGRLKGGDASDAERDQLKGNIKRIATRKGFADALPDAWKSEDGANEDSQEADRLPEPYISTDDLIALREAGAVDVEGEAVKLAEAAVRKDGTAQVKIIAPGWGSSGYYSESMLQRDGPKVFRRGTPMFVNHPTVDEESARPERDITQLAGVLTKDAAYRANGPSGPGLYGEARIYPHWREFVEAVSPDTGVSIRALGKGVDGEVDGRRGKIIESLVAGKSVDFVTAPGAGGHVMQLFESARSGVPPVAPVQGRKPMGSSSSDISPARAREILQANETMQEEIRDLRNQLARQQERSMFREAKDIVVDELGKAENLPAVTRVRIAERVVPLAKPGADGELNVDDLLERVHTEVKAEVAYLSSVRGIGSIRGMGSSFGESGMGYRSDLEDTRTKELEESFKGLGMSPEAAHIAAQGRD